MKLFILAILIALSTADNYCRGLFFREKYYNVDVIREGISRVHQIAYRPSDNTLYFTFDQLAKIPTRMLGYLNLNTNVAGLVDGIRNATGLTIDKARNRIYVGGSDGLFFLNDANVPEKLPVTQDIKYLFFKNFVYFLNGKGEAFRVEDGTVNNVNEMINVSADQFIIDNDDNIFFTKNKNLFRVKVGTKAVNSLEKYTVTTISTDRNYYSYICTKDGVYAYNKYKYVLDRIAENVNDLRALTFNNNDEPIYIIVDNIVKLSYNPIPCLGD